MIDRYQVRYFLAVVDEGNFSRAAARMGVTQPTLSVGMAKLEQEVGARLFFRNSQRTHLTEAGARFLEHARAIERGFGVVESATHEHAPRRRLRLGVITTLPTPLIEAAVSASRATPGAMAKAPDELEIVEGSERDLANYLQRGRIDVALTLVPEAQGSFRAEPLFSEGYSLAMSAAHPLAGAEVLQAEEVASEVMMVRRQCEALPAVSRFFTERGVRPFFSLRSISDDRVIAMVRAGLGITVMPDCYRAPGLKRPRLAGFDRRRTVGLLYGGAADELADSAILSALRVNLGEPLGDGWAG